MAWGGYLSPHIPACQAALARLKCEDDDARRLAHTVQLACELVENGAEETQEVVELSNWVHEKYVRG